MTAANAIYFSTPTRKVNERSSMVIVARFQDRATNTDVTPTNCKYRLDGECGEILGWTSLTPGTTATITLTPAQTAILQDSRALETKTLSVAADYGLSTQFIESMTFQVRNQPYLS
jgi:hypothetical protein